MSIFQAATPAEQLPIEGQELETAAEEMEETNEEPEEETDNSYEEQGEDEQGEDEQEEQEEQPEPDLIAGKFKSVDDLVNSYKNLEKAFHESRQQPKAQQPPTTGQGEDPAETFWELFRNDPLGTMNYFIENAVQQRTAPIYEERANQQLRQNFDAVAKDYPQIQTDEGIQALSQKIQDLAVEYGNPGLVQNPPARLLREAAKELYGDKSADLYKKAVAKGKQEAINNIRTKQGLSAPTGTKPKAQPKSAEDTIADMIVNAGKRGGIFG